MNTNHTQGLRFAIYARKSSEAEDRQVASIDAQIDELNKIALENGCKIVKIFQESQSAKEPGRPIFGEMVKEIYRGELDGILCWKLDRLARNPVDGGQISWALQQNVIKVIQTYGRTYYPNDNVLMMQVEFGMANQFILDLSVNVKRGLRKKYNMGYPAGMAKLGYINDYGKKGQRRILKDEERFDRVKLVLEEYQTGNYSLRKLLKYANETLGLCTIQRQKEGGKPIKLSRIHDLLLDPFYAGFFYATDEHGNQTRYEVNEAVPRMITEAQYWRAQEILGRKGRPRPSKNTDVFAYNGHARCGACSGSIVAEIKLQLICSGCKYKFSYPNKKKCPKCSVAISKMKNPKYLRYVYYHCVKFTSPECKERSITEQNIDAYFADYVSEHVEISPELSEWCIRNLKELHQKDEVGQKDVYEAWRRELAKKEREEVELMGMRVRGLIKDEDFIKLQGPLQSEIKSMREKLGGQLKQSSKNPSKPFTRACGLTEVFRNGTYRAKRDALGEVVSNLTIKDKIPTIYFTEELTMLIEGLKAARAVNGAFEPRNCLADKDETEVFASVRPTLLLG